MKNLGLGGSLLTGALSMSGIAQAQSFECLPGDDLKIGQTVPYNQFREQCELKPGHEYIATADGAAYVVTDQCSMDIDALMSMSEEDQGRMLGALAACDSGNENLTSAALGGIGFLCSSDDVIKQGKCTLAYVESLIETDEEPNICDPIEKNEGGITILENPPHTECEDQQEAIDLLNNLERNRFIARNLEEDIEAAENWQKMMKDKYQLDGE